MSPRHRRPCPPLAGALAAVLLATAFLPAGAGAEPPIIDHQAVPCSLPGAHPRICATIADDGTVERAKIYFRAAGQEAWYWSEMELDFRRFCATLPVPEAGVRAVDYYLWAVDDGFESERTRDQRIDLDPGKSCPRPLIDDDPERTSRLEVWATVKKQGRKLRGFESTGVTFHRTQR